MYNILVRKVVSEWASLNSTPFGIIKGHNKSIISAQPKTTEKRCNCRKKNDCPLNGNYQIDNVIYNALVTTNNPTTSKTYIGLTESTFKQRFTQHKSTLTHKKHQNSTELSKYVWQLKDKSTEHDVNWSIATQATAYTNKTKRCNLCLTEKLHIINADKTHLLNRRSELISKCRHENKYYLRNFRTINTSTQ